MKTDDHSIEETSEFLNGDHGDFDGYHDYRELRRHGRSVIGTVSGHGRRWFVKSLAPELADSTAARRSLSKEFNILLSLNHPGIVRAIEFTDIPGVGMAIVMEYLEGTHLDEAAARMTSRQKRRLALRLVYVLGYLHSRGITHGDLKPENIMVGGTPSDPRLTLIDFNLADSGEYTVDKEAGGNRRYAAPEQFDRGYRLRPSADVYSLGLILRQLRLGWRWKSAIRKALTADPAKRLPDARALQNHLRNAGRYGITILSISVIIISALLIFFLIGLPGENDNTSKSSAGSAVTATDSSNTSTEPLVADIGSMNPVEIPTQEKILPETAVAVVAAKTGKTPADDVVARLDPLRIQKEQQIKQIFKECEKEIRVTMADTTIKGRGKLNVIGGLYGSAVNRALSRFGEFLNVCPTEYVNNPPKEWEHFISKEDFFEFDKFYKPIKMELIDGLKSSTDKGSR